VRRPREGHRDQLRGDLRLRRRRPPHEGGGARPFPSPSSLSPRDQPHHVFHTQHLIASEYLHFSSDLKNEKNIKRYAACWHLKNTTVIIPCPVRSFLSCSPKFQTPQGLTCSTALSPRPQASSPPPSPLQVSPDQGPHRIRESISPPHEDPSTEGQDGGPPPSMAQHQVLLGAQGEDHTDGGKWKSNVMSWDHRRAPTEVADQRAVARRVGVAFVLS